MDCQASLSLNVSGGLPRFMSIALGMAPRHLILWHPLPLLPSTSIRIFSSESAVHIRRLKYWSFCFSINLSNESSMLTSVMIDWFHLSVQKTFRSLLQHRSSKTPILWYSIFWSLLQHRSSKTPILWYSIFFTVQLSQPYVTTGETIALTVWTLSAEECLCSLTHCLGLS